MGRGAQWLGMVPRNLRWKSSFFFNLKLLLMFISSIFVTKTIPHALFISVSVIMSAALDYYFAIKAHCLKNVSLSFHLPLLFIRLCCIVLSRISFLFIPSFYFHALYSLEWSEHLAKWCVYFNERTPILLINTTIDLVFTHQINCLPLNWDWVSSYTHILMP